MVTCSNQPFFAIGKKALGETAVNFTSGPFNLFGKKVDQKLDQKLNCAFLVKN